MGRRRVNCARLEESRHSPSHFPASPIKSSLCGVVALPIEHNRDGCHGCALSEGPTMLTKHIVSPFFSSGRRPDRRRCCTGARKVEELLKHPTL